MMTWRFNMEKILIKSITSLYDTPIAGHNKLFYQWDNGIAIQIRIDSYATIIFNYSPKLTYYFTDGEIEEARSSNIGGKNIRLDHTTPGSRAPYEYRKEIIEYTNGQKVEYDLPNDNVKLVEDLKQYIDSGYTHIFGIESSELSRAAQLLDTYEDLEI